MTTSCPYRAQSHRIYRLGRSAVTLAVMTLAVAAPARSQAPHQEAPLTLRMLLDSVRTSHPLIGAADARIRAARGARTTAGTLGNPVLGYEVDNASFPGGRPITGLDREAMTTATLPLEPLFQRGPKVSRANADVRAAEADAMVTRQRLALDASRAYYRVAMGQVTLATSRDLAGWLDTVVTYNQSRVKEGVTSEADLIRSQLERDRAGADAAIAEAELAEARGVLAGFIGDGRGIARVEVRAADAPLTIAGGLGSQEPRAASEAPSDASGNATALTQRAMSARGEVRAARERLTSASAGVTAEQRMLIRQLGATIGTKQMGGSTSMIAGISVPIPLFDANRGEVQRASAERDAAAFELANQERVTSSEVLAAYESARVLTVRAKILTHGGTDSFLARADEARRIALGAYREGAVPLFQVIDAARTWGDARLTYYRTLYAQHQSVLALLAAEGTDLFYASSTITLSVPAR